MNEKSISDLLREAGVYHIRDAWSRPIGSHAIFSPDGRYLGRMTATEAVAFLGRRGNGFEQRDAK